PLAWAYLNGTIAHGRLRPGWSREPGSRSFHRGNGFFGIERRCQSVVESLLKRVHGISGLVEATGERFDVDDAGIICKLEYVERSEEDDLPFLIEWQHPDVDRRPVGSGNEDAKLFVE